MAENLQNKRWGDTVGVATSSVRKFDAQIALAGRVGVGSELVQLPVEFNLEEGNALTALEAGREKIRHFAPSINALLAEMEVAKLPDTVQVMDVLPIVQIDSWKDTEKVMKKPAKEEGSCLEVTTQFFAKCLDSEEVREGKPLDIMYFLVHAFSPVNRQKRRIEANKYEVVYDRFLLQFSHPLVQLLANPGKLTDLARRSPTALAELLTEQSVRAFRMSVLIPIVAALASRNRRDGLSMEVFYPRLDWQRKVDDKCDLDQERVSVGVDMHRTPYKDSVQLKRFIDDGAQNATPWLVAQSFLGERSKLLRNQ